MKTHRLLSLVAGLGLFATLIAATTGLALAWAAPSIASVCTTDQSAHNWTVTLAADSNYNMEWAGNSTFTSPTAVTMHVGANSLSTPASVTTLYVRWASDHSSKNSAAWSGGACATPTPSPTATRTTTPTATPTQTKPGSTDEPPVTARVSPFAELDR